MHFFSLGKTKKPSYHISPYLALTSSSPFPLTIKIFPSSFHLLYSALHLPQAWKYFTKAQRQEASTKSSLFLLHFNVLFLRLEFHGYGLDEKKIFPSIAFIILSIFLATISCTTHLAKKIHFSMVIHPRVSNTHFHFST